MIPTNGSFWRGSLGFGFLLACVLCILYGCVPVFSDLQSARLLGPGKIEITPGFSTVGISSEGESEHVQNHYGGQVGIGILNGLDFRLRYERFDDPSANVLGFGPKFRLYKNHAALYVPVGFAFGGDIEDPADIWSTHPTLLFTVPVARYLEINPSAKVMIPFQKGQDTLDAFNLGTAISSDVTKWAIRPEAGICFNPGESGLFWQFSIGLSVTPRIFSK